MIPTTIVMGYWYVAPAGAHEAAISHIEFTLRYVAIDLLYLKY